jgi:adenylate cyclase
MDTINKIIRSAKAKLQGVATISFLIGLLGAIILASIIISPVKKLVLAMGKVAKGDLKQQVRVRTGDEIQVLAHSFNRMTDGLSKYVSAGLVKKLMQHPEALTLGGSYKRITILESDIRNFTGMSEKMQPDEVVSYLNEYLDIMSKVVIKHGGEIDKYMGDAILAHFGMFDPNEDRLADNAKIAVRVAVEMNQALIPFNEKRKANGLITIRFGVGIHTANIIVGNIGSTERMDYTVIGDGMNLTSRICGHAGKDYTEENGNVVHLRNILITESAYELVKDVAVVEDKIIHIKVKGKEKPVKIYQVYDVRG